MAQGLVAYLRATRASGRGRKLPIDFAQFDNDGPDGMPDSGDDDGVVDMVVVITPRLPPNFLVGAATGIANLGFDGDFATQDPGRNGEPIRVLGKRGITSEGATFDGLVGAVAHEMGHTSGKTTRTPSTPPR